jgi:hypothetical protein
MESSTGPADFAPRVGELKSLMQIIDRLLQVDHRAFNRAPDTASDKSSPTQYQNRMIIVGDWNIRAHDCGEHYWMVRMLREHFGYAVDVSMAYTDASGDLRHGMHVGAAGYGPDDVPIGYQNSSLKDPRDSPAWIPWQDHPNYTAASAFPWWAVDWRDKETSLDKTNERLSAIVLVGRGWAYDDPVLGYTVMSDSNYVSPMNALGRGVEMYRGTLGAIDSLPNDDFVCATLSAGTVADDSAAPDRLFLSYVPSNSLGCDGSPYGGTKAGAAALFSDHRPMGARLRIWSR